MSIVLPRTDASVHTQDGLGIVEKKCLESRVPTARSLKQLVPQEKYVYHKYILS